MQPFLMHWDMQFLEFFFSHLTLQFFTFSLLCICHGIPGNCYCFSGNRQRFHFFFIFIPIVYSIWRDYHKLASDCSKCSKYRQYDAMIITRIHEPPYSTSTVMLYILYALWAACAKSSFTFFYLMHIL